MPYIALTMAITINGQLLLCMLAEKLLEIPGLKMIQGNTDGITVLLPRKYQNRFDDTCAWWEVLTSMELEHAIYNRMFIRDVNNYIAEYDDITKDNKRKGYYGYKVGDQELEWHKDHSALIAPKAAEAVLVDGADIREFITQHDDDFDFCLRAKLPRSYKLMMDSWGRVRQLQNTSRYYISNSNKAGFLFKVMPPTPKQVSEGKTDDRHVNINSGWGAIECNDMADFDRGNVDYEFYIQEAEKNILPLMNNFNESL